MRGIGRGVERGSCGLLLGRGSWWVLLRDCTARFRYTYLDCLLPKGFLLESRTSRNDDEIKNEGREVFVIRMLPLCWVGV